MPEAIATTKRKFYKALDSFTSGSQVSLVPTDSPSVAEKKPPKTATEAFDEARDRAKKRLRLSASSDPAKVISSFPHPQPELRKPGNGGPKANHAPNYSPWSQEMFLDRLKTFSNVSMWHPKPDSIGEVEWAKRGWTCVAVNTVGCKGGCEKRVVVDLDMSGKRIASDEEGVDDTDEDGLELAFAQRYQELIAAGHSESCLWRKMGCKDEIYHLQVVRASAWQPQLRKRYLSVLEIHDAIDHVKLLEWTEPGDDSGPSLSMLESLPPELLETPDTTLDSTIRSRALTVALHGWFGLSDSGNKLLKCDACFQRIGLWMYQPDYKSIITTVDGAEAEGPASIDLVDLHRDHCPWRNASSQRASESLSALNAIQILRRSVKTCIQQHRRRWRERDPSVEDDEAQVSAVDIMVENIPVLSRQEVALKDKERESKLKKLKSLLTIKRRPTITKAQAR